MRDSKLRSKSGLSRYVSTHSTTARQASELYDLQPLHLAQDCVEHSWASGHFLMLQTFTGIFFTGPAAPELQFRTWNENICEAHRMTLTHETSAECSTLCKLQEFVHRSREADAVRAPAKQQRNTVNSSTSPAV